MDELRELAGPGGATLAYRVLGHEPEEAASVLACHPGGPGMSGRYFEGLGSRLPEGASIVLLDPRASGGSDPPADGRYELEGYAQDLEALRVHLGQERLDLLGHSHGGFVALTYALAQPDRVRRLVLACTAPRFSDELSDEAALAFARHEAAPWYPEAIEAQRARSDREYSSSEEITALYVSEMRLWFGDDAAARDFAVLFAKERPAIEALHYFNDRVAPDMDLRPGLPRISAPTLILNGTADFFGPRVSARELAEIPGSEVVMVDGAGHFPWADAGAGEFLDALIAFLR